MAQNMVNLMIIPCAFAKKKCIFCCVYVCECGWVCVCVWRGVFYKCQLDQRG